MVGVFNHLTEKSEGKLKWSDKDITWTQWMFQCFDEYMMANHSAVGLSNYMEIDRVWRDGGLGYIILALEHENKFVRKDFLGQEIQHLIDLKATYKVAITYPQVGEEEETLKEVTSLLNRSTMLRIADPFSDEYLVIFGFATRKDGKPAILWKGYTMGNDGKLSDRHSSVVLQGRA